MDWNVWETLGWNGREREQVKLCITHSQVCVQGEKIYVVREMGGKRRWETIASEVGNVENNIVYEILAKL